MEQRERQVIMTILSSFYRQTLVETEYDEFFIDGKCVENFILNNLKV